MSSSIELSNTVLLFDSPFVSMLKVPLRPIIKTQTTAQPPVNTHIADTVRQIRRRRFRLSTAKYSVHFLKVFEAWSDWKIPETTNDEGFLQWRQQQRSRLLLLPVVGEQLTVASCCHLLVWSGTNRYYYGTNLTSTNLTITIGDNS